MAGGEKGKGEGKKREWEGRRGRERTERRTDQQTDKLVFQQLDCNSADA